MRRLIFTGTVICFILAFSNVIIAADIFDAAEQGFLDTVKTLIESNPQLINFSDEGGYTPLHKAAYNNQVEVLNYLITKGADLNAVSNSGSTPMHGAAFYGHAEAARALIENGAEIDTKNNGGYTPFLSACAGGKLNVATLLLENKADINAQTADGQTALHNALWNDNGNLVKLLIENGIDLSVPNQQGISPLYYAVAHRSKEIASLLIDKATDYSGIDDFQLTMLHYAAARGFDDLVRKLVVGGMDVNAECINGKTPLYYASLWGQNNIMDYLKENGAIEEPIQLSQFTGEYLGQKKPGKIPEVFAENALLTPFAPHGILVFSPDGNDMIWCHQAMPVQAMWYIKKENGVWQRPVIAPFTDPDLDYADGSPCFSQDGSRIYYHSHRPLTEGGERKEDLDIWYVEKTDDNWGVPANIGYPVNSENNDFGPAVGENGNLYFVASGYDDGFGESDIYFSRLTNGQYSKPINLGAAVNSESHELTPALAPDESYIIFASNRPNVFGQGLNLYVSWEDG
jgi:ankyrin repeat protein